MRWQIKGLDKVTSAVKDKALHRSISSIVRKNILVLLRAKSSALIVIFGPLLIVFLAGLAFDNSNTYALNIGTYSSEYNDLTNSFIQKLNENRFNVERTSSEQECTRGIKTGELHACIVFSPKFSLGKTESNEIKFYVDYSRINLVWTILGVMTSKISERSLELSRNLTSILLNALDFAETEVQKDRSVIVRLTTENNEIAKKATLISSEFGELDLSFDESAWQTERLSTKKNVVKQWIDNSLSIGKESLERALSFVGVAKSSATGEDAQAALDKTTSDIAVLLQRFNTTQNLVGKDFEELSKLLDNVVENIKKTKIQVTGAEAARNVSGKAVDEINLALEKSLINMIAAQDSMNKIENSIKGIEIKDPEAIVQPIVTQIKPVVAERTYLNYLFPIFMALVVMITSILLAPTLIMLEKTSTAFFRNFMTPAKDISFFVATYASCMLLMAVQAVIVLAIAGIFFSAGVLNSLPATLLALFLIISIFTFIGMAVGYVFNSEETATLASVSLGVVFILFSNVIIPLESMPGFFKWLSTLNPFVLGGELLRKAIVFNSSIFSLLPDIGMLFVYAVLSGFIAGYLYIALKQNSIQNLMAKLAPKVQAVIHRQH